MKLKTIWTLRQTQEREKEKGENRKWAVKGRKFLEVSKGKRAYNFKKAMERFVKKGWEKGNEWRGRRRSVEDRQEGERSSSVLPRSSECRKEEERKRELTRSQPVGKLLLSPFPTVKEVCVSGFHSFFSLFVNL